jgi:hypothetical protein
LTKATTTASYIGIELLQVLKNTTATSSAGKFGRKYVLLKENPDGHTFRAFNHSLTTQWDVLPQERGLVREYYRVKESNTSQFAGIRMNYHVWRQRFIATAHSQRRLISDKAKALSNAIDKKERLTADRILRTFRVKLEAYRATLDTYRIREAEFMPTGQLYREIKGSKTSTLFPKDQINLSYPMSTANLHPAFRTVEDHDVRRTGNKGAVHQVELDDNYVFHVHEDTTLEVLHHLLKSGQKLGRKVEKSGHCDGRGKSSCRCLMLRSTCASGPVMSNAPSASKGGDEVQVAKELDIVQ